MHAHHEAALTRYVRRAPPSKLSRRGGRTSADACALTCTVAYPFRLRRVRPGLRAPRAKAHHAACNKQPTTCNRQLQHAACTLQQTACDMAPYNPGSAQRATCVCAETALFRTRWIQHGGDGARARRPARADGGGRWRSERGGLRPPGALGLSGLPTSCCDPLPAPGWAEPAALCSSRRMARPFPPAPTAAVTARRLSAAAPAFPSAYAR